MNRYTLRTLFRSIRQSLGRYLAILAIVALGVGFFAGLKSSCPAMLETADSYLTQQHFSDYTLLSSLGLTAEDAEAFAAAWPDLEAAEGGLFADAWLTHGSGRDVYHIMSLPERVDLPSLTAGRLPERAGECLADSRVFSAADLGTVLTLEAENDEDTRSLLPGGTYTIVGLAKSPRFISDVRGDTSLGSGKIAGFVYVLPADFDSEVFHEIRLRFAFPGALYSEEYEAARDRRTEEVKALFNRRGDLRYRKLRREADEKLRDARRELDDGWREYNEGVETAEKELADAELKLRVGEQEYEAGRQEFEEYKLLLDEALTRLPDAPAEIARGRAELAEQEAALAERRAALEAQEAELDAADAALGERELALAAEKEAACAPHRQAVAAAEQALAEAQAAGDASQIAAAEADLAAAQTALAEAEASFAGAEAALADERASLDGERGQLDSDFAALSVEEAALEEGRRLLDSAEEELKNADWYIAKLRQYLESANGELINGRYELDQGWKQYEEEKAKAEKELADAKKKLEDGEAEYADAVREAEEALRLELYTLDRDTNAGYVSFESDVRIIDGLADVFPVFFVLVAALVCVTTMTRMVGEERTLIGTMKAMGYADGVIMAKYLLYSGSAAVLGCVTGYFLGTALIPRIVWFAYAIIYDYAKLNFYFSPVIYLLSLAAAVASTVLVTWLSCRQELREKPAELIRPKAPKAGKRLFLEHLSFWKRLPFLSKVSLRNAFRYPLRTAMMLLGIGGCTALLVAGFGARDSVADIADLQYGNVFLYDMAVNLDTETLSGDDEAAALWEGDAAQFALTRQEPVTLRFNGRAKSTSMIASAPGALDALIRLADADGAQIPYPEGDEAVVTEKIAENLKLRVGDSLQLETDGGEKFALRVSGVCKNYLNHYVFLSDEGLDAPHNTALLRVREGTDAARAAARLRGEKGVSYVTLTAQERAMMEQSMQSLDLLVLLLILCSGALAVITLYNLTNINIMERTREIATVKVLGFTPRETAEYVLRENLLLALLGTLFGLWLGKHLHAFVIRAIVVDNMSCDTIITLLSYAVSFVITMVFTLLTNLVMRTRLEKVNMAESLKSVE